MLKNYAKKSLLFLVLAVAIYANYLFVQSTEGLEKIFGYAFAFCILAPILANTLYFFIIPVEDKKPQQKQGNALAEHFREFNNSKTPWEQRNPNYNSQNKKSPVKVVNNENYEAIRNILIACSKNKLFSREDILEILSFINYKLGTTQFHYKDMNFDNEMHEIYTKLKNKKFTDCDYKEILDKLETITNQIAVEEEVVNGEIACSKKN